jgi:hypothetical protein
MDFLVILGVFVSWWRFFFLGLLRPIGPLFREAGCENLAGCWLAAQGIVAVIPEGRQPELRKDAKLCVSTECMQIGRKAA